jgi:hypothetical protein
VRQFLASPQGLQIDRRGMVVRLSALFQPTWQGAQFVNRYGAGKAAIAVTGQLLVQKPR